MANHKNVVKAAEKTVVVGKKAHLKNVAAVVETAAIRKLILSLYKA